MFLHTPLVYAQRFDAIEAAKVQQTDSFSLEYIAKKT